MVARNHQEVRIGVDFCAVWRPCGNKANVRDAALIAGVGEGQMRTAASRESTVAGEHKFTVFLDLFDTHICPLCLCNKSCTQWTWLGY